MPYTFLDKLKNLNMRNTTEIFALAMQEANDKTEYRKITVTANRGENYLSNWNHKFQTGLKDTDSDHEHYSHYNYLSINAPAGSLLLQLPILSIINRSESYGYISAVRPSQLLPQQKQDGTHSGSRLLSHLWPPQTLLGSQGEPQRGCHLQVPLGQSPGTHPSLQYFSIKAERSASLLIPNAIIRSDQPLIEEIQHLYDPSCKITKVPHLILELVSLPPLRASRTSPPLSPPCLATAGRRTSWEGKDIFLRNPSSTGGPSCSPRTPSTRAKT
jgi:hypothetical protein